MSTVQRHVQEESGTIGYESSLNREDMRASFSSLARDILSDPIRIVQGEVGEVSSSIGAQFWPDQLSSRPIKMWFRSFIFFRMVPVNGPGYWRNWWNSLCVSVHRLVFFNLLFLFPVGKVLIFVTRKDNCSELAKNLKENGFTGREREREQQVDLVTKHSFVLVGLIHGDMAQFDRTQVISDFKKRDMLILIATDVAGRSFVFAGTRKSHYHSD